MVPKIIKLGHKEDVTAVIKHIKSLKDREVIFDVEIGSILLTSSESLKLIKKTGEVLGKTIQIKTQDETGQILARKVGMLAENSGVPAPRFQPRVARSDIKPRGRFSDIVTTRNVQSKPTAAIPVKTKPAFGSNSFFKRDTNEYGGSRLEIEVDKTSSKFSKIFILFLVVVVVTVFGLAVLLPRADITVFARSEPVTRDFQLTVDHAVTVADPNSLQIPGILISKSVSQTKSFPTTGTKSSGAKAGGTVTIYNFTPNPLKLKAATTTLVAGGKKFLLVSDVSGIKPNGVPTAGIEITAETGGSDYNLPANTKFQIINTALGNQNVYALNPEVLTGGTTGTSTKVLSQQDLDDAANILISDIISQTESDLSTENGTKIRVPDSGVTKDILAKTANKNVGDVTDSFDMTMIAKVTGLGFKEDNVIAVVVAKINQVLSNDKYLVDNAQIKYTSSFKSVDQALGKGLLDVHFQTIAAYKVDTANLSKILAGKNESEIKEILLSKPEIDKVEVKFWPAWFVHKAPRYNGKINLITQLSPS